MRFFPEYEDLVQPPVLVASGIVYLAVALGLYKIMRDRPAFELKIPMMIYNLIQIVVCGAMTFG